MVTASYELNVEVMENGFKNLEKGWKVDLYSGDTLLGTVPVAGTIEFFATGQRMSIKKSHIGHIIEEGIVDTFILMNENGMWVKGSVGGPSDDVDMRFDSAHLFKGHPVWIDIFTIWCGRG